MLNENILFDIIQKINGIAVLNYGDQFNLSLNEITNLTLDTNDINYIMSVLHSMYKVNCVKIDNVLIISKTEYTDQDNDYIKKIFIIVLKNIYNRLKISRSDSEFFIWDDLYNKLIPIRVKQYILAMFQDKNILKLPTSVNDVSFTLYNTNTLGINANSDIPFPEVNEELSYIFTNSKT